MQSIHAYNPSLSESHKKALFKDLILEIIEVQVTENNNSIKKFSATLTLIIFSARSLKKDFLR